MFLHVHVPAFYAAVHQAADPRLRGRPVAVAADAGADAPLLSCSAEATAAGLQPGERAHAARRRCRGLIVVTPDGDLYRRAQESLITLCATLSPHVGGAAGDLTISLAGTERIWGAHAHGPDLLREAGRAAERLRATVAQQLSLDLHAGVAIAQRSARLAARAATARGTAVVVHTTDAERDTWPLAWIDGLDPELLAGLRRAGVATIGDLRARGLPWLLDRPDASASELVALLLDEDEPDLPPLADPQPGLRATTVVAAQRAIESGEAIATLANRLAAALRGQHLATATLRLRARRTSGGCIEREAQTDRQLHATDDLHHVAAGLLARLPDRTRWTRFDLIATDLCTAEEQLSIFSAAPAPIPLTALAWAG